MEEGSQGQAPQVQPSPQQPQPQRQPEVDAARQRLAQVLGDILTKAQELGFELATLDYSQLGRCPAVKPVIDKARELIMKLKEMFALSKALGQ